MHISIGPCHPSAHGVFRLLALTSSEILHWLDSLVGLLHRSTEWLLEHRTYNQVGGYLSRTDYVAHITLESMAVLLSHRAANTSEHLHLMSLLTWVANHLLNLSCGLADLGCVSSILWAFDDREQIYDLLETAYGARLHISIDTLQASSWDLQQSTQVMIALQDRGNVMTEILKLRIALDRLAGVASYTVRTGIGRLLTGVHIQSTGVALDLRIDCTSYLRSSLAISTGGVMGCSLLRAAARLYSHPI